MPPEPDPLRIDSPSRSVPVVDADPGADTLALLVDESVPQEHLVQLLAPDAADGPRRRVLVCSDPAELGGVVQHGEVLAVVVSATLLDPARAVCPDYSGSWIVLVDPASPTRALGDEHGVHCIRIHTMFCSALPMLVDTVLRHRSGERRLESALSQMRWQADRLHDAERVAHIGSWVWEVERDALWFSPEFRRIRGGDPESGTRSLTDCLDELPPGERPRVQAFLDRLSAVGGGGGVEYRFVRPDGSERHLRCEAQAETDPQGRVLRLVGTEQDITDLRRSERALLEREEFLRIALETARVAAWRWDPIGRQATLSAGAVALLGLPPGARARMSLTTWLRCVAREDRAGVVRALRAVGSDGGALRIAHRTGEADGGSGRRWVEITGATREGTVGPDAPLIGAIQDVTAQRRDELERLELQNELRHAAKMEAVGRLAAGAAHDFNNVLTAILGHAQLGRLALSGDAAAESPVRVHLDAVEAACRRATALTRQLLTIGRREPPGTERIDVHAALAEHEAMLRRLVRADIEMRVVTRAESSVVAVDRARFDQILMNLVVNACDAMPKGGVLEIGTANVTVEPSKTGHGAPTRAGAFLRLRVADTGVGISDADRERVFEPFFTTKERDKGTGLGLSIIQGIVEQAGGFIRLQSRLGEGTRFDIHLPLVGGDVGARIVPRRAASSVVRGGSETILVCEDEADVRSSMASLLRSQGYSVLEASDGQEALSLVEGLARPPELLLTDVVLTRLNGPQLARRLREQVPGVAVLFISGYGLDELASMGAEIAGSDLLRKPFGGADLLQRVRALLDERARSR